jgi:glycosyltransferase involved in cell wall biosynthesis
MGDNIASIANLLISVVIPVYNSRRLEELADRIRDVFRGIGIEHELVLVDDGSPDPDVWRTAAALARERAEVVAIQLSRNFGQQPATLCGLQEARGDFVVTMDDDLQHLPEDIPKFLELRNWDIVIGQFPTKQHTLFRRVASRVKGQFDRIIVGKPKSIQLSPFRLLSRTVVNGMLTIRTPNPFIPALMFHVSKKVIGVEVRHGARAEGKSGYDLPKLVKIFSDLLINNSSLVLRLVGQMGVFFSFVSFVLTVVVVVRRLIHSVAVQGWASLMAALLFIGGLLLFGLGIVGEYLIRIIQASESRPTYFVRERVAGDLGEAGGTEHTLRSHSGSFDRNRTG